MDEIDRSIVDDRRGVLDISWITERIALGGWVETEEKMQAAAKVGITHIINMTWECDNTPLAKPYRIRVLLNPTDDDFQSKPPELLERGVKFALAALGKPASKLLIHCVAGRHRGPMMTLALFSALGWPMEDAMRWISERRPIVDWAPIYLQSIARFVEQHDISRTTLRTRGNGTSMGMSEVARHQSPPTYS